MARPKQPEPDRLNRRLKTAFTTDELRRLKMLATERGIPVATLLRSLAIQELRRAVKDRPATED